MSKRLIAISLLILLISACAQKVATATPLLEETQSTQPAPSNTLEPEATFSVIAAWTELALTKDAIVRPTLTATPTAVDTATAQFAVCPGAPGPYVAIGKQVRVVSKDVDKLKLRSEPKLSPDTIIRDLDQFTQMTVVGGPICVRSAQPGVAYWFWQVKVLPSREVG